MLLRCRSGCTHEALEGACKLADDRSWKALNKAPNTSYVQLSMTGMRISLSITTPNHHQNLASLAPPPSSNSQEPHGHQY